MRRFLTPLDAEDHLAHDFELLPVDAGFVLTHEGFIPFFCGDQVAPVKREEWDPFRERIFPGEAVGTVASLSAHEDDKAHEVFLGLDGNQFPRLCETVDRGAIDGGDDST